MSSVHLDLDMQMIDLESEWRLVYEDSINARADYQALAASSAADAAMLDAALERLEKAEAMKARTMAKIERLEFMLLGRD
jgi:hypothetical protein